MQHRLKCLQITQNKFLWSRFIINRVVLKSMCALHIHCLYCCIKYSFKRLHSSKHFIILSLWLQLVNCWIKRTLQVDIS
jgi:MFS-type transporter involved in bile tolerance (Atg22 family)